jgi:FixJ family two-component response regulator
VPKRKPLISIVDDDESVREATKGLIKSLGYMAEVFPSAEDFLQSQQVPRTSCLIADVNMPGMSGSTCIVSCRPRANRFRPF